MYVASVTSHFNAFDGMLAFISPPLRSVRRRFWPFLGTSSLSCVPTAVADHTIPISHLNSVQKLV